MDLPTISVVTPSFNQALFLERTIKSVLDQTYPGLQYLVLDGGSKDDSPAVIRDYSDRLTFWRSHADAGQAAAVNEGWRRSNGEILGWVNSDDYYLPGALMFVGEYFAQHPETTFIYGSAVAVDSDGQSIGTFGEPFNRDRMLMGRQPMPQPSSFIRRSLLDEVGLLDESLTYAMDLDLFIRASSRDRPVFLAEPLAAFTVHPAAKTIEGRSAARREVYAVCLRHATGLMRWRIRGQALLSTVFQGLPAWARRGIDALRPSPFGPAPR